MATSLIKIETRIKERMMHAIREKVMPGGVVGVITRTGEQIVDAFGRFTYDPASPRVSADTMYDVASLTKAIPGSMILLRLLDEGKIRLDDRLIEYVPEFDTDKAKHAVLIRHILSYTLDLKLPSLSSIAPKGAERIMHAIMHAPLACPPGTRHVYTNSTAAFIHLIVKKVTGKSIDVVADELFFHPLQMGHTTFHPERYARANFPPTEIDASRGGEIRGVVHDESAFVLQQKSAVAIAGLFSTAPDMLTFLEMLLHEGVIDGSRYVSEALLSEIMKSQAGGLENAGLGWWIREPFFMGKHAPQIYGQTGFTGCAVWVAPELGVACVLLSNSTYPKRGTRGTDAPQNVLRRDIADIIFDEFAV